MRPDQNRIIAKQNCKSRSDHLFHAQNPDEFVQDVPLGVFLPNIPTTSFLFLVVICAIPSSFTHSSKFQRSDSALSCTCLGKNVRLDAREGEKTGQIFAGTRSAIFMQIREFGVSRISEENYRRGQAILGKLVDDSSIMPGRV
jgi:hypothetical protein